MITQLMMSNWQDWLGWLPMLLGCIAVWKPKGVCIAKKTLENCYDNNPQGAGFAICKDNKIEVHKGYFKFSDFWKAFRDLQKYPALIHFRIATHGAVNKENCHPFIVADGKFAMVHNGILGVDVTKDESDSAYFAKNILEPFLAKVPWEHEPLTKFVNDSIGSGNKVVVMRNDGKSWIFNEKQGDNYKGCWYSNTGYKYNRTRWTQTNTNSASSGSNRGWAMHGCYRNTGTEAYWRRFNKRNGEPKEISPTADELAVIEGDNEFAPEGHKEKEVEAYIEKSKRDAASLVVSAAQKAADAVDVKYNAETNTWSARDGEGREVKQKGKPRVIKAIRKLSKETYAELHKRENDRVTAAAREAAERMTGDVMRSGRETMKAMEQGTLSPALA